MNYILTVGERSPSGYPVKLYTTMMSQDSIDDQPLLPTTSTLEKSEYHNKKPTISWRRTAFVSASVVLNFVFILGYISSMSSHSKPMCPPEVYSPAQDVLEYVSKSFNSIWNKSIYNGPPSPGLDEAWVNLYNVGIMQLPKSQAALLPNKTEPIPGDEQNYIFSFDVFHQLHCLNLIRQALHPEYYTPAYYKNKGLHSPLDMTVVVEGHADFDHIGHCIDSLRESLTCSADITPIVWTWDTQRQRSSPTLEIVHHTCRNYEQILDWARAHRLHTHFNATVHVEDGSKFAKLG